MPSFRFRGFASASAVTIAVSQGAASAGPVTVSQWEGPTATLTVAITLIQHPMGIAPHGVHVKASVTGQAADAAQVSDPLAYNPAFHRLSVRWAFGDTGNWPLATLGDPSHRQKNFADGLYADHVYTTPGAYSITCFVYDDEGRFGTASTSLTVADPATAFTAAETLLVSDDPAETWVGAPTTVRRYTSLASLNAALPAAVSGLPKCRILFKRGGSWVCTSAALIETHAKLPNMQVYWGAWGTGADPWFDTWTNGVALWNNDDVDFNTGWRPQVPRHWIVTDLEFRGAWLSETETVRPGSPGLTPSVGVWSISKAPPDLRATFHNVTVDGLDYAFYFSMLDNGGPTQPMAYIWFASCTARNEKDYSWFSFGYCHLALIACRNVASSTQAQGMMSRDALSPSRYSRNSHTGFRGSPYTFAMRSCHFQSNHGWSGSLGNADFPFINGPLRWNSTGSPGLSAIVSRSLIEGQMLMSVNSSGDGSEANGHNLLVEKCMVLHPTLATGDFIKVAKGGTTFRNNILIVPNTPRNFTVSNMDSAPMGDYQACISFVPHILNSGLVGDSYARPQRVYGNTFAILRTEANKGAFPQTVDEGPYTSVLFENNLTYAPNVATPIVPVAMDTTTLGFNAVHQGMRKGFERVTGSIPAGGVANGASFSVPYPGDMRGVATVQANYSGTLNRHSLTLNGGTRFGAIPGDTPGMQMDSMSVSFGATSITVTNRSGTTWAGGASFTLRLDRGTTLMPVWPLTAVPAGTLARYRPAAPLLAATAPVPVDDFSGVQRAGSISVGAWQHA